MINNTLKQSTTYILQHIIMRKSLINLLLFQFLMIIGVVCACGRVDTGTELFESIPALPVADTLSAHVISFENETELLHPVRIVNVNDSYLVISDNRREGIFQVFNMPELEFLYSWGQTGRGPDEFLIIPVTEINTSEENELILYEIGLQQLRYYKVSDSAFINTDEKFLSHNRQIDPLTHVQKLNNGYFVADYGTSFEDTNHEYIVLAPDQQEAIFTFGKYPSTELEGPERYFKYIKTNTASHDGSKFAAFYVYHNMFKIFNSEGQKVQAKRVEDRNLTNEATISDSFLYSTLEWASDNYLYSLGWHAEREKISENPESFKTSLEIWDWEGKPVYRASFDRAIHGFTVSENHGKLYGFTPLSLHEIYVYDLPDITKFNSY
ncbi:MAG: hypothetical protein JJU13_04990 [Balneolaceae bacterium]|nr:hypothetical protein [Balneolaceae bacterium]